MNKPIYCTLVAVAAVIAYLLGLAILGSSPAAVGGVLLFLIVWNNSGIEYDLYTLGHKARAAASGDEE